MAPQHALPTPTSTPQKPKDADEELFRSSIETLVKSDRHETKKPPTPHDICDAYDAMSSRIRAHPSIVTDPKRATTVLQPLKNELLTIVGCLRRDINRAKHDCGTPQHQGGAEDEKRDPKVVRRALESTACCHSAIRFLSVIFRMPVLQSVFAAHNLGTLLDILLDALFERQAHGINGHKTYEAIMWTLKSMELPASIYSAKAERVYEVLKLRLRTDDVADADTSSIICDALKVTADLLRHRPSIFLSPLTRLLPQVLTRISTASFVIRSQAGIALGRYALCLLDLRKIPNEYPSRLSRRISDAVITYVTRQWQTYSKARKQRSGWSGGRAASTTLPGLIFSAFSDTDTGDSPAARQDPLWGASVLSSLVVLLGHDLYKQPCALKMVLQCVATLTASKCRVTRELHPLIWKCCTWAFSEVAADGSERSQEDSEDNTRERALAVVKQELGKGLGLALVAVLLCQRRRYTVGAVPDVAESNKREEFSTDNISQALAVIADMVHAHLPEGLAILKHLVGTIGFAVSEDTPKRQWTAVDLVNRNILTGSTLPVDDTNKLQKVIRQMNELPLNILPSLSEEQIMEQWDPIFALWTRGAEACIKDAPGIAVCNDLEFIWQSLLLVQAQLTQGHSHLTAEPENASQVAALFERLLALAATIPTKMSDSLRLLYRLWVVVTHVFSAPWLSGTADVILTALLNIDMPSDAGDAKDPYGRLCHALLYCGTPPLLLSLHSGTADTDRIAQDRKRWMRLARIWPDIASDLQDTLALIIKPFRHWDLTAYEIVLWEALVQFAITLGKGSSSHPSRILQDVCSAIEPEEVTTFASIRQTICVLLRHVDVPTADDIPSSLFLLLDKLLAEMYGSASPGCSLFYEPLEILERVMNSLPPSHVLNAMTIMKAGLLRWIQDEKNLIPEKEYNHTIMSLYSTTLAKLGELPRSVSILECTAEFLASAFYSVRPLALGPSTFKRFWESHYRGIEKDEHFPPVLSVCLAALYGNQLQTSQTSLRHASDQDVGSLYTSPLKATPRPHRKTPVTSSKRQGLPAEDGQGGGIDSPSLSHGWKTEEQIEESAALRPPPFFAVGNRGNSSRHPGTFLSKAARDASSVPSSVPRPISPPLSSPLVSWQRQNQNKRRTPMDTPLDACPVTGKPIPDALDGKKHSGFSDALGLSVSRGGYSSYDRTRARIKIAPATGSRLDFAIAKPDVVSPGIFPTRASTTEDQLNYALPLASPFVERPFKRMRAEEDSTASSSLVSMNDSGVDVQPAPEASDRVENSGWAEPPTQATDISDDHILTAWDRTESNDRHSIDVLDSSSVSLGGDLPRPVRSQTAPASSSHASSSHAQARTLRRSLTAPAPSSADYLETLRQAVTLLSDSAPDLSLDQLLEGQKLVSELGYTFTEQLGKRLRGAPG
ncbi:hypothetical protein GLOTRDRAFT_129926 [Gloeophyllum trabeum ATCC 11539]|uniref:Telomere-associated protein Rif1 N-terminal domain-containing protein n=1 Tax=Gloeophyllum trabeum (strain ATCC 11539 / FP-39264 / Madison 617) TaxID=670483 RepID=S7Q3L6_GLOTA|nr:uncharacterized protein GLOTRDRAFT_129926 [Gloeophyllum trabeum ATCC 11539]EPQ54576.1 hypothetical protein GLOTRDRAFT_129926 [Gloeophyllum trabeum ATCC 11539]